jgi:hypothetical protein
MAVLSVTGFPAALCPKKKRGPVPAARFSIRPLKIL